MLPTLLPPLWLEQSFPCLSLPGALLPCSWPFGWTEACGDGRKGMRDGVWAIYFQALGCTTLRLQDAAIQRALVLRPGYRKGRKRGATLLCGAGWPRPLAQLHSAEPSWEKGPSAPWGLSSRLRGLLTRRLRAPENIAVGGERESQGPPELEGRAAQWGHTSGGVTSATA